MLPFTGCTWPLYIFVGRVPERNLTICVCLVLDVISNRSYICTNFAPISHFSICTMFFHLFWMSWLLREAATVSTKTYSVPELDLKLDLSYITPRLIVCSGPVNSYRKSWYRYTTTDLRVRPQTCLQWAEILAYMELSRRRSWLCNGRFW